jgi:hypothetical protein
MNIDRENKRQDEDKHKSPSNRVLLLILLPVLFPCVSMFFYEISPLLCFAHVPPLLVRTTMKPCRISYNMFFLVQYNMCIDT